MDGRNVFRAGAIIAGCCSTVSYSQQVGRSPVLVLLSLAILCLFVLWLYAWLERGTKKKKRTRLGVDIGVTVLVCLVLSAMLVFSPDPTEAPESTKEVGWTYELIVPREMPPEELERLLERQHKKFVEAHAAGLPAKFHLENRSPITAGDIKILNPAFTATRETRPSFYWAAENPDVKYLVTLCDAERRVVFTATTSGLTLPYPDDAAALFPGSTYFLHVQHGEDTTVVSGDAHFQVLALEDQAELENALRTVEAMDPPPKEPLRTVSLLMAYRLYDEARVILEEHLRSAGDDPDSMKYLAAVYKELGWLWKLTQDDD
ncbi:MAG: hypothetical protein V2B19_20875 [Pseudomonadota bacterium]